MAKSSIIMVKEWLEKAESDYRYAKMSFGAFDDFYSQICVLCHDSAEKYLKAYIIYSNREPAKIHDLVTLHRQCVEISRNNSQLASLEDECRVLNRYYIPLKYPSHYPAVDKQKAGESMEAIEKIRGVIKGKMKAIAGKNGPKRSKHGE